MRRKESEMGIKCIRKGRERERDKDKMKDMDK